jgi:AcrR family transcriptional regulator
MSPPPRDSREAILDTAERLFAERGLEGASLREISAVAGHRNHSAAQYHFGDRTGLVVAIVQRRLVTINARRLAMLAELDRDGRGEQVGGVVAATVRPAIEVVCVPTGWYGRFLARTRADAGANAAIAGIPELSGIRSIDARLRTALSDLPRSIRRTRIDLLHTLMINALAEWEWGRDRGRRVLPRDILVQELTMTGTALLLANRVPDSVN